MWVLNQFLQGWIITSSHVQCSGCLLHSPVHPHKMIQRREPFKTIFSDLSMQSSNRDTASLTLSTELIVCLLLLSIKYHWGGMAAVLSWVLKGKHMWAHRARKREEDMDKADFASLVLGVHSVLAQHPHMWMRTYAFYYVNISTLTCSWNQIYRRIAFQRNMEKVSCTPMYISLSIEIRVFRCMDSCTLKDN